MRTRRLLLLAAVALAVAACGDTGEDDAEPEQTRGDVVIVSQDIEFGPTALDVPAGREVEIVHENRDEGTNHNVHLTDAPGSPKTPLEQGPTTQTLRITLEPGSYTYVCDLHPTMRGTLTAR